MPQLLPPLWVGPTPQLWLISYHPGSGNILLIIYTPGSVISVFLFIYNPGSVISILFIYTPGSVLATFLASSTSSLLAQTLSSSSPPVSTEGWAVYLAYLRDLLQTHNTEGLLCLTLISAGQEQKDKVGAKLQELL
ncbi:hypothetical protein GOODEAATRI_023232 [Goodea atripinnis]|uniref:Uncharacterized protein n=1 Tax=Goodea atripinnis TaxID=208336 RepID=A0ABV0NEF7_9TELE